MAISNGLFKGAINGVTVRDYSNKLDYNIEKLDHRKENVSDILNLDQIGSNDEFWQDIWDMGICKANLNKDDSLWTDTNIAKLLESMGTYLIAKDDSELSSEKKRFNRPKKEVEINGEYSSEDYAASKNDKNYRLAPPDEIKECDYKVRSIFNKDYSHYKEVLYPKYIKSLEDKISSSNISRYGYHDGYFDIFSCGKLMTEEKWNNLKRLELEKVKLLKDAKSNLNILKKQNKEIQNGSLYFRPYKSDNKIEEIEIYKYDFITRITPCNIQLKKSGYNFSIIKEIEDKFLYKKRTRRAGVGLRHITNNISDINEYMIMCKLAYTNRVCITPDKNSVNMDILEHVNYKDLNHIESILYMNGTEISYENDMSIISYDLNNAIRKLKIKKVLDDKDLYIIEGIRHKITQEEMAKELSINESTIWRRIKKINEKIKKII